MEYKKSAKTKINIMYSPAPRDNHCYYVEECKLIFNKINIGGGYTAFWFL